MPSSGRTNYLNLPQWLATDHPHMPGEINAPFAALDAYAAGRRLQTYTALDQIGLSGLVNTAQVCAALPAYSQLVLRQALTDASRITDAPYDWVMMTITRPGLASDCKCVAESLESITQWFATYQDDGTPVFSGWVDWFARECHSAVLINGAENLDGNADSDFSMRYTRTGRVVSIHGIIDKWPAADRNMFVLPEGFRPAWRVFPTIMVQDYAGRNKQLYTSTIYEDGGVRMSYGCPACTDGSNWLMYDATFIAK